MEYERTDNEITCPFCGYEHGDSWECGLQGDGDTMTQECEGCGKKFYVVKNVSVDYSTRCLCTENGLKHKYESFDRLCDKMEFTDQQVRRHKGKICQRCSHIESTIEIVKEENQEKQVSK